MDIIAFTYPWGYCEDSFIKGVSNLETFLLDAHKKNSTKLGSPLNSAKQPHKHFIFISFLPSKNLKLLNKNEHRNMENKFLICSQKDNFQTSLQKPEQGLSYVSSAVSGVCHWAHDCLPASYKLPFVASEVRTKPGNHHYGKSIPFTMRLFCDITTGQAIRKSYYTVQMQFSVSL